MKLIRILIVALFTVSCSRASTPEGTDRKSDEASPAAATSGETRQPAATPEPATRPNQGEKSVAALTPVADQAKATGVNPDAAVLADFKSRIDAYMKLRKEAVKDAPRLKETKDPAKISAAQDAMSIEIRAARANATHGDIFTPEITAKFRRLLAPELKGDDGRDAKAIIKDDAPTNVTFKVNAKYPEGAPVPTVPASLLVNLPTLPEPLQFRIIEKHLILLDEDADIIVDYALNIIK
jgi:hypothetical protein